MSIQSNVLRKNDLCPSRPEWDAALEAVRCGRPVILKDDADRVRTIRAAIHPDAKPQDLASPGHVFPLRAHPDGVRGRVGGGTQKFPSNSPAWPGWHRRRCSVN